MREMTSHRSMVIIDLRVEVWVGGCVGKVGGRREGQRTDGEDLAAVELDDHAFLFVRSNGHEAFPGLQEDAEDAEAGGSGRVGGLVRLDGWNGCVGTTYRACMWAWPQEPVSGR